MGRLNITFSTGQVLQALASGYHYGFDIMDATGLPSGTVYPILRRLDGEGLVQSRWEKQAEAQAQRQRISSGHVQALDGFRPRTSRPTLCGSSG